MWLSHVRSRHANTFFKESLTYLTPLEDEVSNLNLNYFYVYIPVIEIITPKLRLISTAELLSTFYLGGVNSSLVPFPEQTTTKLI